MTVYLVGAGPGDPGLLTVRASAVLAKADVVVHDRLAESSLLDLTPSSALRIDVGKAPGGPVKQEEINELLVQHGSLGKTVVRLKGGDPFVFGRGGEEAMALAAAGIEFEVVPGVTSAIAAPAYAGVPVTHRGLSTSFTVVTGHSRHAVDTETNWEALAAAGGTIIVLMGVAHREQVARRLMAGGLSPNTAVAAVTWGTRPEQQTVRTTLAELGSCHLEPPAAIVIGAVAGLGLEWFEKRPLLGRKVVVTRARHQASVLSARLRELGALPVEVPTIKIEDPSDGGAELKAAARSLADGGFAWVAFTSANAVLRLFEYLPDVRSLAGTKVAAIGPATAAALAECRVLADLVPERHIAEGLAEVWPLAPSTGGRVLLPRAEIARDVLPEQLKDKGWEVETAVAYRTTNPPLSETDVSAVSASDAICFTSASSVNGFVAAAGTDLGKVVPPVVVCIGPETARAAVAAGLTVSSQASDHTIEGLLRTLQESLTDA